MSSLQWFLRWLLLLATIHILWRSVVSSVSKTKQQRGRSSCSPDYQTVGSEDSLSLAQYEDYLRADSAFANDRLMSWCEKNSVKYVFGLQKNDVLLGELATETEEAKGSMLLKR